MLRLEAALAELYALDGVHVEGAEVAEQVVHVIHAKPVVLDPVLVRGTAAHEETGRGFVAPGHTG